MAAGPHGSARTTPRVRTGWTQCVIGANLTGSVSACGEELAFALAWSLPEMSGEEKVRATRRGDGRHATDGGREGVAQHVRDAPRRHGPAGRRALHGGGSP